MKRKILEFYLDAIYQQESSINTKDIIQKVHELNLPDFSHEGFHESFLELINDKYITEAPSLNKEFLSYKITLKGINALKTFQNLS